MTKMEERERERIIEAMFFLFIDAPWRQFY